MGLKTACLSVTAALFVLFVFISIISDDIQGIEVKKNEVKEEQKAKSHIRKRESSIMDDYGNDEVSIGGKRFKLYEKKQLNYKKAKAYCKKNDGKLAEAMNLEEMRRLQVLIMRAKSISNDMWVGADKKEWKKHSLKMQRRPNFGPDPMLFGGGPTEMCPALGVSTRSLIPVMCTQELPFICEFDSSKPKSKKEGNTKQGPSKDKEARATNNARKEKGGQSFKGTQKEKAAQPMRSNAQKGKAAQSVRGSTAKEKAAQPAKAPPQKEKERLSTRSTKRRVEMRRKRELPAPASTQGSVETESSTPGTDIIEMGVSTKPVTESPASVAAEHQIGFSPHVEHVAFPPKGGSDDETTPLFQDLEDVEKINVPNMDENDINMEETVRNSSDMTTTLHPDQMLINLMDEQTLNLTAIELEAAAVQGNNWNESQETSASPQITTNFAKVVNFPDDLSNSLNILPSAQAFQVKNSKEVFKDDGLEYPRHEAKHTGGGAQDDATDSATLDVTVRSKESMADLASTSTENGEVGQYDITSTTSTAESSKRLNRKAYEVQRAEDPKPDEAAQDLEETKSTLVTASDMTSQVQIVGSTVLGESATQTMTTDTVTEDPTVLSPTLPLKQAQVIPVTAFVNNQTITENYEESNSTLDFGPQDMSVILEEGYVMDLDGGNSTGA